MKLKLLKILFIVAASALVYFMMYVVPMPPCFLAGPVTPGCSRFR